MSKVKILESTSCINESAQTKVVTMGNIIEVTAFQRLPHSPPIRKVNKDYYVDLRSGEIGKYKHIENRSGSTDSIRKTMRNIRNLINTNITDPLHWRWITLTYRENMTDTKLLYKDFERFWKRFCYWCKASGFSKPEYISVVEPQSRGAWHIHAFFGWSDLAPFIPNNEVMEMLWPHGFTKTKALNDCDNIGAYFSAYLADMPLNEVQALPPAEKEQALAYSDILLKQVDDAQQTKKFVKGGRLYLYPSGMNIVRKSRGIKSPTVERMSYEDAQAHIGDAKQTYARSFQILDDTGQICNTITKAFYNRNRK